MALEVVALRPGGETELLNVVDVEMVTRRPGSESFLNISLSKGTYNYMCVQRIPAAWPVFLPADPVALCNIGEEHRQVPCKSNI